MPSRAIVCGGCPAIDCPAKRTSPASARYTPVITLKTVVLPAPFGPDHADDLAGRRPAGPARTARAGRRTTARAGPGAGRTRGGSGVGLGPGRLGSGSAAGRRSCDGLHPARPEQPLRPGVHHHDQDRADQELPGDRTARRPAGSPRRTRPGRASAPAGPSATGRLTCTSAISRHTSSTNPQLPAVCGLAGTMTQSRSALPIQPAGLRAARHRAGRDGAGDGVRGEAERHRRREHQRPACATGAA